MPTNYWKRVVLSFLRSDEMDSFGRLKFYLAPNAPEEMSIGFTFIQRDFWGTGVNYALKTMMFNHIFHTDERMATYCARKTSDPVRCQKNQAHGRQAALKIDLGSTKQHLYIIAIY